MTAIATYMRLVFPPRSPRGRFGVRMAAFWGLALLMLLAGVARGQSATSVVNSPHNLSVSGPGNVKASSESEVCIFCHAPHKATPVQPLWNRNLSGASYKPYASTTLKSAPGQPTGSSKLCLSCHDGTIALGAVNSRSQNITMSGGVTQMPQGAAHLDTDLSDDHPISFKYNTQLALDNPKLRDPGALPANVKLDANKELQCTSCHTPHDNSLGKFLVMSNPSGELCRTCHQMGNTNVPEHQTCNSCHQSHTAPSGPHLLKKATENETCVTCHTALTNMTHADGGTPTTCSDCHEAHTVQAPLVAPAPVMVGSAPTLAAATLAPAASPALGQVSRTTAASTLAATSKRRAPKAERRTPVAMFEYQVCLKCHSEKNPSKPTISRVITQTNLALKFDPAAVSFHPVQAPGRNHSVPSLKIGLNTTMQMFCTDCHGSDRSKKAGGHGPNGPHGSTFAPQLLARYDAQDPQGESPAAYDLCYRCHERSSILGNQSFRGHKQHIVDYRTPCSVCHDAHGIPAGQGNPVNNWALINFDTSAVRPDAVTRRLEYQHTGENQGRCSLTCHGKNHSGLGY